MRGFSSVCVGVFAAALAVVGCNTVELEPTDDDGGGNGTGAGNLGGGGGGGGGGGDGGGGGACVDPGAFLGWTIQLPDGEEVSNDDVPPEQIAKPFEVSGLVEFDGSTVIITDSVSDFRFSLRDGAVPLETGLVAGESVTVTGSISSVVYPGSPVEWRLAMRVDNDPGGGGTEAGERLWLMVAGLGAVDTTPFVIDLEDETCSLEDFFYQSRWLVSLPDSAGVETITEGESALFVVSGGPHAGDYEVLGFNATLPLEGSSVNNLVVRRAP